MTELPEDYKEMLVSMTEDLNGEITFLSWLNSLGQSSQKIVIEYNKQTTK